MGASFKERKYSPVLETCFQPEFVSVLPKVKIGFDEMYFVVGRTNTGGRFYSDSTNEFETAAKTFIDYQDMIGYFGGGTVEFFAVSDKGYDIIAHVTI